MDNFNWGVRRPGLSQFEGGSEMARGVDTDASSAQGSINEITPVLPKRESHRTRRQVGAGAGAEESSDDEMGPVS